MTTTPAAVLLRWPPLADGSIPARVVVAGPGVSRRDFAFVALHASRIERVAADPGHPYHEVGVSRLTSPFEAGARHLLPAPFSDRKRVLVGDVRLDGPSLPGDFDLDPPDLREIDLRIDSDSGTATVDPPLADDPTARARTRLRDLRDRGAFGVTAVVARAHPDLSEPLAADCPGLVLVTFDPTAEVVPFLTHVASYLSALAGGNFRDEDKAAVAAMLADERFVRDRRRRLPGSMTDGRPIFLCDLLAHRPFLRGGVLADTPLRCVAEAGPTGRIELCPFDES
jgi:hypothetical protein